MSEADLWDLSAEIHIGCNLKSAKNLSAETGKT
jgi:hypothetical protein